MHGDNILLHLFMIFAGSALFATAALYARQAMIVAYILLGLLLGPSLLNLIPDPELIGHFSDAGIMFLLFLLGMNLHPQKLIKLFQSTLLVTFFSCLLFAGIGYGFAIAIGLGQVDAAVIAVTMMFSSTIIGVKLLPTTVLHHQKTGEIIISILLLQDIIAICALVLISAKSHNQGGAPGIQILLLLASLPVLAVFAKLVEKHLIERLFRKFSTIQEYIFLLAVGWCLGIAELANWLGLSYEMGAFIAGVTIASSPISTFIAESLKPLRDFFLVLFFFSLGASIDLALMQAILLPATGLALIMLLVKPFAFKFLLMRADTPSEQSLEVGVRLGQISEFSLLISMLALNAHVISEQAANLIQTSTIISFILSSYLIVLRYPTPIAVNDSLRRD